MILRYIFIISAATLAFNFTAHCQYKFYSEKDSIEYNHYRLILSKGYKFEVKDGAVSKVLVDSSYLNSENQIPIDSAIKMSRKIPKFTYNKHTTNGDYTTRNQLFNTNQYDTITHLTFEGLEERRLPILKILKCKNLKKLELIGTTIQKIPWILNWNIVGLDSLTTISIYNHARNKTIKFTKNSSIKKLVFYDNPYSPVPKNYYKLSNLEEIDFVRNDFKRDTKYQFDKVKQLKKINLSKNNVNIANLANDTLNNVSNLILSFNNIKSVPAEIGLFKNLKVLQLAENDIKSNLISPALGTLKHLSSLSFYKNELSSLPPFLFNLTLLKEFDLYFNKIEVVPNEIGNLTQLERLYLANNQLYSIPETIGKLTHLKELYLHHNRISYLPNSICKLTSLTDFHMNNNYFQGFPTCVLSFTQLEDLDISFNEIHTVPSELLNLKKLKFLWMRGLVFEARNKTEANEIKHTLETLQKNGVKVSIELE